MFSLDKEERILYFFDAKGNKWTVCNEIDIENINENVNTGQTVVTFKYYKRPNETKSFLVDLESVLNSNDLLRNFGKNGVPFAPAFAKSFIDELSSEISNLQRENKKMSYTHSNVGWDTEHVDDRWFYASKSINTPITSILSDSSSLLLETNGSLNEYLAMIEEEVIPNKNLQLPFVLGFAAPVISLVASYTNSPVILTNFAGISSTGKTTSLALIASLWGSGKISNNTIIKTFLGTENAFVGTLGGNHGIPVMFDDYEGAPPQMSFRNLFYMLQTGEGKQRCSMDGSVKRTKSWSTLIGTTGETSIFEKVGKEFMGLRARIVEFRNIKWTSSAKNSENIMACIAKNYGFLGPKFVEKLKDVSIQSIERLIDEYESLLLTNFDSKGDGLINRVSKKLAIILATADMVKSLLHFDIDIEYLIKFLINNELGSIEKRDTIKKSYEEIIEYVNIHYSSFVRRTADDKGWIIPSRDIEGKVYCHNGITYVAILPRCLDRFMKMHFNDRSYIVKQWKERGYLECDADHLTKKIAIVPKMSSERCYVLPIIKAGDKDDGNVDDENSFIYSSQKEEIYPKHKNGGLKPAPRELFSNKLNYEADVKSAKKDIDAKIIKPRIEAPIVEYVVNDDDTLSEFLAHEDAKSNAVPSSNEDLLKRAGIFISSDVKEETPDGK